VSFTVFIQLAAADERLGLVDRVIDLDRHAVRMAVQPSPIALIASSSARHTRAFTRPNFRRGFWLNWLG
jgi:hypothetical protein